MQALNAGPGAMADLERAVTEILSCFPSRPRSFLTDLFFAAHRPHTGCRNQVPTICTTKAMIACRRSCVRLADRAVGT
ncbi:hypothetical protein ACFSOZ_07970 [Mesorhizobium newzealandense]|uniref:Uncharacterized protein n=1 Tax=Mesorhizobium newzealandense TaxID=1300302 RepID=A0ABW4U5P8_9HYPH